MIRRSMVGAIVLAALVCFAIPASAKGISSARFTGPGLPIGGLFIQGDHPQLGDTGVLDTDRSAAPFSGATGPAYHAEYRFDFAPGKTVRQIVYPYAAGGPRTFTPPGQSLGIHWSGTVPSGWYQAVPSLLPYLVTLGFPSRSPVAGVVGDSTAPTGASSSWPAWAWALIALALGTAVLLVSARQRRRAAVRA